MVPGAYQKKLAGYAPGKCYLFFDAGIACWHTTSTRDWTVHEYEAQNLRSPYIRTHQTNLKICWHARTQGAHLKYVAACFARSNYY